MALELKNKKIIVTGGAGFLGGHIIDYLTKEEKVNSKNIFVPRSKDYDLRKEEDVRRMFKDFPADMVVHLATTVGGINYNKEHPGTLYYENLIMNSFLIEIAKQNKIEKFLAAGTALAYPAKAQIPLEESSLWDGYPEAMLAPIGMASKMMLVQIQAYRKEFGFNAIYVMPSNLYGPGDHFSAYHSHVIPATIKKFDEAIRKNNKVDMWGTGRASREFLYVKDAARGLILALKSYDSPEPLNLGSGEEITIKELAEVIASIMNFKGEIFWDKTKPEGQLRRCLENKKAREELGFKPSVTFKKGLEETIKWYSANKIHIDS